MQEITRAGDDIFVRQLLGDFDPGESRDPGGRWTSGEPGSKQDQPQKAIPPGASMPEKVVLDKGLDPVSAQSVTTAFSAISQVHHDGNMAKVPVRGNPNMAKGVAAEYDAMKNSIDVNTKQSAHPALTATHEIGHYLDRQGLGNTTMAYGSVEAQNSPYDSPIKSFHNEVSNSPTMQANREAAKADPVMKGYADYLTNPQEMFGRAYAQYIAMKSQDPKLMHELDVARSMDADVPIKQFWPDDEFESIGKAVEEILRDKGWLNE